MTSSGAFFSECCCQPWSAVPLGQPVETHLIRVEKIQIQWNSSTGNFTVSFFERGLSKQIPHVLGHRTYLFLQISDMHSPHFKLLQFLLQGINYWSLYATQTHTLDSQIITDMMKCSHWVTSCGRHLTLQMGSSCCVLADMTGPRPGDKVLKSSFEGGRNSLTRIHKYTTQHLRQKTHKPRLTFTLGTITQPCLFSFLLNSCIIKIKSL